MKSEIKIQTFFCYLLMFISNTFELRYFAHNINSIKLFSVIYYRLSRIHLNYAISHTISFLSNFFLLRFSHEYVRISKGVGFWGSCVVRYPQET